MHSKLSVCCRIKMKILSFIFLLSIVCLTTFAQHDPSDQMTSVNWDLIGTTEFRVVKNNESYAIFSKELKESENKLFELEGYMVPMKNGLTHTRFMLSTLPINQCFFCGQNGVPIMILVELREPIKFTYGIITVKGILKLSTANAMVNPPISLVSAKAE